MIIEAICFMLQTNIGALIFSWSQPRRKWWWMTLSGCLIVNFFGISGLFYLQTVVDNVFLSWGTYFFQYLITFLLVLTTFDCQILTALFCGTVGYCLQHIATRVVGLLVQVVPAFRVEWIVYLLRATCTLVIYSISALFFFRRNGNKGGEIEISNPIQLIVSTCALGVMIIIEDMMIPYVFRIEETYILAANFISSIIFALIILMLEFNVLIKDEYRFELNMIKQITAREREQYVFEKALVDTISIKYHDLKHQLNLLDGRISREEIQNIKRSMDIYRAVCKTGNTTLDVVLTAKSLICVNKNIEMTAMIDGTKLAFMQESDIYSMFGNLLDNAIEAVDKVQEEEKRIITLSLKTEKGMLFLHMENYYAEEPVIVDGLPRTTKGEDGYHGFGLKSIRNTVQKYGGDFRWETHNDTFVIDIMFF